MNTIKTARKDKAIFTPRGLRVRVQLPQDKERASNLKDEISKNLNERGMVYGVHYKIMDVVEYKYRGNDVYYYCMSKAFVCDLNTAILNAVERHNALLD